MASSKLKLLFIIAERNMTDKIVDATTLCGVNYQHSVFASGSAKTYFQEITGLGDTEKSLIVGTVLDANVDMVKRSLTQDFAFNELGKGIAFTIPISAVGGPATLQILAGTKVNMAEDKK